MCHNYRDNFKLWGVKNFTIDVVEVDNPSLDMDIYVSPYGLGSTQSFMMNISTFNYNKTVNPWMAGLDVYQFTKDNTTYCRLDYVWSKLSSLSPGPAGFQAMNDSSGLYTGCGSAEKGLCHAAADAVALSFEGKKKEFPEYPNGSNKTLSGSGVFFQHEMTFTTAQYAAKPVKICGACHVFKLPPMDEQGHPLDKTERQTLTYKFSVSYNNCRNCHESDPEMSIEAHNIHTGAWTHEGVSGPCSDCHKDIKSDPEGCLLCHFDSVPTPEEKCLVCHIWGVPDWKSKFDNIWAFHNFHWADLSEPSHGNVSGNCSDCHGDLITKSNCNKCHDPSHFNVSVKPPDWTHASVPCIRCHVHAGINDKTVSGNPGEFIE